MTFKGTINTSYDNFNTLLVDCFNENCPIKMYQFVLTNIYWKTGWLGSFLAGQISKKMFTSGRKHETLYKGVFKYAAREFHWLLAVWARLPCQNWHLWHFSDFWHMGHDKSDIYLTFHTKQQKMYWNNILTIL